MKHAIKEADGLLKPDTKDPHKALQTIVEMAMELAARRSAGIVVDFRQAYDVIIPTYAAMLKRDGLVVDDSGQLPARTVS